MPGSSAGSARLVLVLTALLVIVTPWPASAVNYPALPRVTIDTTYPVGVSQTFTPASATLAAVQAALDAAVSAAQANPNLNYEVVLTGGTTYTAAAGASLILRNRSAGTGWIIIRSSALANLPLQGIRVSPSNVASMATIRSASGSNAPVVVGEFGAHHYWFAGIHVTTQYTGPGLQGELIIFGYDANGNPARTLAQIQDHIVIDRCYVNSNGGPVVHAIVGNASSMALVDSYVVSGLAPGTEIQAFAAWSGPGPIKLDNNYFKGLTETVLLGGASTSMPNGVNIADVTITRNLLTKDPAWKSVSGYSVKNGLEFKHAVRVLVEGNVIEYAWVGTQSGTIVLFTPRDDDSLAPWQAVQDVTLRYNVVRHASNGFQFAGTDNNAVTKQLQRIHIHDNLIYDINGATWNGSGVGAWGFWGQTSNGTGPAIGVLDVTVNHNTFFETGGVAFADTGNSNVRVHAGVTWSNNIMQNGSGNVSGFRGSGTSDGDMTFSSYFVNPLGYQKNVQWGGSPANYTSHPDNYWPAGSAQVGFINFARGDYTLGDYALGPSSAYGGVSIDIDTGAVDGSDPGADMATLIDKTAPGPGLGAVTGVWLATPSPVPSLTSLVPNTALAGAPSLVLTVNGSNFTSSSVVRWNGADRATTFVSGAQLQAAIPASDIAAAGTAQVTVLNPAPGGGTSNALTFTITPSFALSVVRAGTGSGTVTSAPSGITCGSSCSARFASGATVGLTAVPDTNSTFGSWSGCDSAAGTQCTVAVTATKTVTATFQAIPDTMPPTVTITSPTSNATYTTSNPLLTLGGTASDNVGVTQVTWANSPGGGNGTATGTTSWTASGIALQLGTNVLTITARDAAANTSMDVLTVTLTPPPPPSPYKGSPFAIPGLIEAEDFDNGGESVAYHDLTAGNQGGQYRLDVDVDIISPASGAYVVNSFQTGEWLSYSINVTQAGTYRLEALVSSQLTTGAWHAEIDGVNVTGSVLVPNTGSWGAFQWVGQSGVVLTAGRHILKVVADQQYFNLDAIRLTALVTFTDDPLVAQTTPVKALHITEVRAAIDSARVARGLAAFAWTDPTLTAGSTLVKAVHLTELRIALNEAYQAASLPVPTYTDPSVVGGTTVVKAVHLTELRTAVLALQ